MLSYTIREAVAGNPSTRVLRRALGEVKVLGWVADNIASRREGASAHDR
jgi:hypothetical protein